MSGAGIDIELGARTYRVVPQRIGRIRRKLTEALSLLSGDGEAPAEFDDQLYEAFRVFIPDLAPKYELLGYASEEAMQRDEYDPDADRSPTGPQIADALDAIYKANGGDRFARLLGNVISPDLVRAWVRTEGLRALERATAPDAPSPASASSPSAPGGAPSTASTTSGPTLEPSATEALQTAPGLQASAA